MTRAQRRREETRCEPFRGSAREIAEQIRIRLKKGGSVEHATGVQWFFKDEIRSHGWYTAEFRKAVRSWRYAILKEHDFGSCSMSPTNSSPEMSWRKKLPRYFCSRAWMRTSQTPRFVNSKRGSIGSAVGPITMRSYTA